MQTSAPMIPFLRSIAREIVARYGTNLKDFCFILPGRRAALFLNKYIEEVIAENPSLSFSRRRLPRSITLAELVERITGLKTATRLEQIFALFTAWRRVAGDPQDFDRFRAWAETVLSDFEEIDSYDIDAHAIFANIEDYNAIATDYLNDEQRRIIAEYFGVERPKMPDDQFWANFRKEGDVMARFLLLWQRLAPLYDAFHEILKQEGLSYVGAMTRRAADIIEQQGAKPLPANRLVMAGFDMLPPATLRLFKALRELRDADGDSVVKFFWDAPGRALAKDSPLDAGRFQWKNMELFPQGAEGMELYTQGITFPPSLNVRGCPGNVAQTKVAGKLLDEIVKGHGRPFVDPARIAVILPDESLLFPMYYSVPEHVAKEVNVTMGYPLRMTPTASFVMLLRKLRHGERTVRGERMFHNKDVRTLLAHPYMHMLLGVSTVEDIQGAILAGNNFYVSIPELTRTLSKELKPVVTQKLEELLTPLSAKASVEQVCAWLSGALLAVLKAMALSIKVKERKRLDILHLQKYLTAIEDFAKLQQKHGVQGMNWRTALLLIDRMLQTETVHLQGEPLTGLQIMGMLETRALDFDYIIIPSMNERIFPRRFRRHTFIPESLRRGWMLPTIKRTEQVYAYHFHRLIARAKEVHLLYDASQGGRKSGDPSRYLLQLRYLFGKEANLHWDTARFSLSSPEFPKLTARKNMDDLRPYITPESGVHLSASALKDYLDCTFRFYLARVLKKKLRKEPEEFMDAATQGTILHDTMQALYDSLIPKGYDQALNGPFTRQITASQVGKWLADEAMLREIIEKITREKYPRAAGMEKLHGDAALAAEGILKYVKWCLEADRRLGSFEYIENEDKKFARFPLPDGTEVNFTYIIDRLDRISAPDGSDRLRIVDYKTGTDSHTFATVPRLFHPISSDGNVKGIFQLMLYALLYGNSNKSVSPNTPIALSIYRTAQLPYLEFRTTVMQGDRPIYDHTPYMKEFRQLLEQELTELFDPNIPYEQTADKNKCTFCDFKQLCGR